MKGPVHQKTGETQKENSGGDETRAPKEGCKHRKKPTKAPEDCDGISLRKYVKKDENEKGETGAGKSGEKKNTLTFF